MTCKRLGLLLLAGLLPAPALAGADLYVLDPVHTRVLFRVDHAGFSRALGTFSGATGELLFDPGNWSSARLEVEIPLERLDLGDPEWNQRVLGHGFLDAGRHPVARFRSTRVEPTGPDTALVHGELELRGRRGEVVLDVRLNALRRHPLTFHRTAGFSATARLDRRDFGMESWPNVIGQQVELWIEAEAVRSGEKQPMQRNIPGRDAGLDASGQAMMTPEPAANTGSEDADPQSE